MRQPDCLYAVAARLWWGSGSRRSVRPRVCVCVGGWVSGWTIVCVCARVRPGEGKGADGDDDAAGGDYRVTRPLGVPGPPLASLPASPLPHPLVARPLVSDTAGESDSVTADAPPRGSRTFGLLHRYFWAYRFYGVDV
jgi:hypothetical protein